MKHTIHVPGTRCTLTLRPPPYDYKNKAHCSPDGSAMLDDQQRLDLRIDKISKALTKCTGKHKRHVLRGGDKREYPQPIEGAMLNTASYVEVFFAWNRQSKSAHPFDYKSFFEPLSTRPQEWPQEPLYEEIEEDQGLPSTYDFGASESLPAWLTAGVPPEWIKD
jgi:hypothetical protein